jgi:hyperosmotically inducible protein
MNITTRFNLAGAAVLMVALAAAPVVLAQSAKESSENAASSAGHAISHAYHGTATAVEDTTITGKVKTALHDDKVTKGANIHVKTVAGVVTLRGSVASSGISEHAQHLAAGTSGVKSVENKLKISGPEKAAN